MAYSLAAWVGAHTDLMTRINAGAGASTVKIKSAAGTTLATATIDEEDTNVDLQSAVLAFVIAVNESSSTAGVAAYADICDGDETPHVRLPCQQGFAFSPGYAVLNNLNIQSGGSVDVLLAQIVPPAGSIIV